MRKQATDLRNGPWIAERLEDVAMLATSVGLLIVYTVMGAYVLAKWWGVL